MDFKRHLETSWDMTLRFIGPLILMTLVMGVVSTLSFGILAPVVWAGYVQAILLMVREGREPRIQDIFSHMNLFLPLLGFGVAVLILATIGMMMMVLPSVLIVFAISFVCLYMFPLMTDRQMNIMDAFKESFDMSKDPKHIMDHVITVILFLGISAIGSSVFVGWLFTQPLATILLMSVYHERTLADNADLMQKEV